MSHYETSLVSLLLSLNSILLMNLQDLKAKSAPMKLILVVKTLNMEKASTLKKEDIILSV